MEATVFDDVQPWPETKGRDPRYDNEPPLEQRVMLEFEEDLEREGVKARIQELLESAARVPATITDEATAGKVGDLCRLVGDVRKRVDTAREKHNRPLLTAQRSLKGKADGLLADLERAVSDIRSRLNSYVAAEARKREEGHRKAEEEARLAREAAAQVSPDLAEQIETPKVEAAPVARGDLGARVGTRTVWRHEIEVPIAKLPKAILDNEKVRDAVNQVIAAAVRAGTREIKGVRIWSDQVADVR